MDDHNKATTTSLPLEERPDAHQTHNGRTEAISLEQDKDILDGRLPADRFDDERMRDLPSPEDHPAERERTELGNRGPGEVPGFGQGA
jgi:hypothetical protein